MLKPKHRGPIAVGILIMMSLYLTGCGAKAAVTPQQQLSVKTVKVALADLPAGEAYLGSITPYVQTVVSSSLSGIIATLNVRVGDKIQAGQSLASLNTDLLQAQKNQAVANAEVAASQQGATSESTQNSLSQAKAALETAETNLANAQTGAASTVDANQTASATQVSQVASAVAAAQKALVTAKAQLQNATVNAQNDITQKQSGLASAQANLTAAQQQQAAAIAADQDNALKAQDAISTAESQLAVAKQNSHSLTAPALLAAQSAYDQASIAYQGVLSKLKTDQASGAVTTAQAAYDAAESALQASQSSQTVVTAQAQVAQAQQTLDSALTNQTSVTTQSQSTQNATQTTASNSIAAAKAALQQAQVNYESLLTNPLLKVNAAQLDASQAGVEVIGAQINQGEIDSPISGYVVAINAQPGQAVGPQGGFITIASMDPLTATVDIPETSIASIKMGMPMDVTVPAVSETLPGVVSAIHPQPDGTNKKYSIEITLQKGQATLLPSMRAEAQAVSQGAKGIVIPADSVLTMQSGALSVFVLKDGIAHSVVVKVGAMSGSVYEITSGLNVDDQLVVQGQNLLSDGDKVKVIS
ncbi:MAG: efflux RND transporter periplasmic adaptor subunit [Desulfosporosinus sp.]|nr:efflux RND transporter periplasmic adaptor subunit [Desulfosporosinus sp.]